MQRTLQPRTAAMHLSRCTCLQEITRRVNLCDIWQAAYTAGVLLPKPVATCRYWHRSLNPKKLIDVGFSRLAVSGQDRAGGCHGAGAMHSGQLGVYGCALAR